MEKIKVLIINDRLVCGGAEQALFDLINLMDKSRFEVKLLVVEPGSEWDQKFVDSGIDVCYDYDCRPATWNPIQKAKNVVKKQKMAKSYARDGEGLVDTILDGWPDIVVSYNAWKYELLPFATNVKTVKYIHGDPATNLPYREEATTKQALLKRYDRIVCVSQAAWKNFRTLSGLTEGVELHYNPIDSDAVREKALQTVALPTDVPVICAVGRLCAEKGFERLIVIHRKLLNQGIDHKLVIVGDGKDREYIERIVYATDTQDTVILAGYQSNPYPYMKQSKFLVSSSFTEGFPVIAMEALSLGVPIVSAVPSIGEGFGGEVCGIITENDNASLEAGIRKMLTDEAFYAQAKAGAQKRSTFYDGKRMVREVEDMFLSLMEK